MQAYSLDLRERIIRSWQQGQTKAAIARTFIVSLSTIKRYIKRYELYGHVLPTVQGQMQGKLNKRLCKHLLRQVSTYLDYTLTEHASLWNSQQAIKVSESTVGSTL